MDWSEIKQRFLGSFGKYKYVILVICLGLLMMLLPSGDKKHDEATANDATTLKTSITEELSTILGQIRGVGRVRVMITEQQGSETVYQIDVDTTNDADRSTSKRETVLISGSNGENGLIKSVTPPVYLGAIIVCQGGDDPVIKLAVSQAVSAVTGISTDRISVLKMK